MILDDEKKEIIKRELIHSANRETKYVSFDFNKYGCNDSMDREQIINWLINEKDIKTVEPMGRTRLQITFWNLKLN